jgi:RNA polymerase sigma factor (sigma-70 family)
MSLGPTFETALAAARTGAEWAWALLYRDLAPSVLRYLRARGAAEAEDITGEVFVQVVRNLSQFRGSESDFRAWVFTIARNRLVDEARKQRRKPAEEAMDAEEARESAAGRMAGDSPAEAVEGPERLREILSRLTPEQRDVLFLRVIAGLSLEETAQVLGKTPASVKRLQARGLNSLRRKIAQGTVSL